MKKAAYSSILHIAYVLLIIILISIIEPVFAGPDPAIQDKLSPETCLAGMISYFRFSEASGTTTADEAYPRSLSVDGNADWTSGRVGSALAFDGVSQYSSFADHADFDWSSSQDFSIGLWCRITGDMGGLQVILGRETEAGTHWWIGLTSDKKPAFYLYDAAENGGGLVGMDSINDGEWHHIAAVHLGPEKTNILYIDGEMCEEKSFSYTTGFDSESDIQIANFFSGLAHKFFFEGELDELAVWNREVTADEIYGHYLRGLNAVSYCPDFAIAPSILSDADTIAMIDQEYIYEVIAEGYPAPEYDLPEAPTGMSIDPITGIVSWTPQSAGRFNVVVRVTNSGGATYQNYSVRVLEPCMDELVSFLSFDEGSGPVALDKGNLQILDIEGKALWVPGKVESGLSFDGISQGFDREDHPVFDFGQFQEFTLELWFKSSSSKEGLQVMMGRDVPGRTHWWIGLNAAYQAVFYLYDEDRNGGGVGGTDSLNDGNWHHLAAVYQGISGSLSLYVDGAINKVDTFSYTDDFYSDAAIQTGMLYYNGENNFFFDGILDEIALSHRALPAREILEHYLKGIHDVDYCSSLILAPNILSEPDLRAYSTHTWTYAISANGMPDPSYTLDVYPEGMTMDTVSGLLEWTPVNAGEFDVEVTALNPGGADSQEFTIEVVESCIGEGISHFNFEEGGGTVAVDQLGDREGQLVHSPVRQEGLIGNSLLFNGIDQSVILADDDAFDFPAGSSFTFELWCRPAVNNSNLQVMLGRDETDGVHWWIGLQQDTKVPTVYTFDENRVGGGIAGSVVVSDGQWHHLATVCNSNTQNLMLYIDGVLNAQAEITFTAGFSSTAIIQFAGLYVNGSFRYYYEGELDEVVVYNRAVPADEIMLHHELGRAGLEYCFTKITAGIREERAGSLKDFRIYPVPAQDKIHIELTASAETDLRIQLINILGITCFEKSFDCANPIELDVSQLPKGSYLVRILSEDEIFVTQKIIIY